MHSILRSVIDGSRQSTTMIVPWRCVSYLLSSTEMIMFCPPQLS